VGCTAALMPEYCYVNTGTKCTIYGGSSGTGLDRFIRMLLDSACRDQRQGYFLPLGLLVFVSCMALSEGHSQAPAPQLSQFIQCEETNRRPPARQVTRHSPQVHSPGTSRAKGIGHTVLSPVNQTRALFL